ncbi:MAG: hypothetical protein IJ583_05490 [Firmicutes bacterium]|nr:hypothetical protein [Bacillota bacterium]
MPESKHKIRLIIEGDISSYNELITKNIADLKYKLPVINACVIEINEDDVHYLDGIENVKIVYENTKITTQMNHALDTVNANFAHSLGYRGKNITVAFLDTGIAPINDFTKPYNRIIAFKDFINNKSVPYDDNGHGTHVAYTFRKWRTLVLYIKIQYCLYFQ